MARQPMIEVDHLSKYFGDFPAVSDVTFSVNRGEILGFLGPNGAGKSTTMRILTGYMPPTSGTARIAGFDVVSDSLKARQQIGYLPENVPLYTEMTVRDYLSFMGTIRGMDSKRIRQRIDDVVQICRLEDYRDTIIGKLSKGFRQRVGIAQAVLHEPDVLIMDEPTIGIDPIQIVETRQLIKDLGGEHTLILSTHILPEVSMICERVVIIHEGEIVAEDTPQNLAERLEGTERLTLEVRGPSNEVTKAIRSVKGVQDVRFTEEGGGSVVYNLICRRGDEMRIELAKTLVEQGWGLLRMEAVTLSLEEIFLRLTTVEES